MNHDAPLEWRAPGARTAWLGIATDTLSILLVSSVTPALRPDLPSRILEEQGIWTATGSRLIIRNSY
jgi:hypothetical protein